MVAAEALDGALPDSASLVFTGHSLGGGLAIDQAFVTDTQAVVFDAAAPSAGTLYDAIQNANHVLGNSVPTNLMDGSLTEFEDNPDNVQAFSASGDPITLGQEARGYSIPNVTSLPVPGIPMMPSQHSTTSLFLGFGNYINQQISQNKGW